MPVTKYIWDPESDNVLQETDELGATTATYTQEPDEFGGLISQNRGGTKSYYYFDALGSTRELTDENENVTDTNMYDAWGVNVASSGTTENPFRWVGEVGYHFDEEVGEYYVRARRYEPAVAQWLSGDPLRALAPVLAYVYADHNPATFIDPSGFISASKPFLTQRFTPPTVHGKCPGLGKIANDKFGHATTTFDLSPGDNRKLNAAKKAANLKGHRRFIQRVTIAVQVKFGECEGLMEATCDNKNLQCRESSITYKFVFNETFPVSGGGKVRRDNHPNFFNTNVATLLEQNCTGFSPNNCCPFSYTQDIKKEVTAGWSFPGITVVEKIAMVVCRGKKIKIPSKDVTEPTTFPDKKESKMPIKFPNPTITNVLESHRILTLVHERCGDTTGESTLSGYEEPKE